MPDAPRIQPIRLEDLNDVAGVDLRQGDLHEGLRVRGALAPSLDGAVLDGCALEQVELDGASLRGCRLATVSIDGAHAAELTAPRSAWRDVQLSSSRIGAATLFGADWTRVVIRGCRIDYLNLAGASLTDVRIEDCVLGELDLSGATARRIAVVGSAVATLDVTRATLAHADLRGSDLAAITGLAGLRGATVDDAQLAGLAPLLAAELGIEVE